MTTSTAREQDLAGWEKSLLFFFFLVCAVIGAIFLAPQAWQMYARSRTAIIRAVVWNDSQHVIYMNDGTVWDAQPQGIWFVTGVKPLVGDEVRYVYARQKIADRAYLVVPLPDVCDLNDVTIGQKYTGARITSPFTHSSCPER